MPRTRSLTLSSPWTSLTSKLRSGKSSSKAMLGSELKKIESKLEAELITQTKAASKSASRSPKTNKRKAAQAGAPCAALVFERRLVVWRRCLRFDEKSPTSRVKRIWYEWERDVCDFLIKDLNKEEEEPETGVRFKCTIADGEKMMSDRIPGRADTFVVYALIKRVVKCRCGDGLGRCHVPVEEMVATVDKAAATLPGVVTWALEPASADTTGQYSFSDLVHRKFVEIGEYHSVYFGA